MSGSPERQRRDRFWVVALACLVAAAAITAGGLFFYNSGDDTAHRFCTADQLIAPEDVHRDPGQDCQWVDSNGDVYTTPEGQEVN